MSIISIIMFADLTADTDCLCSAPCNLDTYVHPTPYIVQQRTDSICILYDSSVVKLRENCFRVFVNIDRLDKIGRTTFSTVVNSENLSPTIFRHSSMVDIQRRFEDPLLCSMQPLARHHLKTLSRFVVLLLYIFNMNNMQPSPHVANSPLNQE